MSRVAARLLAKKGKKTKQADSAETDVIAPSPPSTTQTPGASPEGCLLESGSSSKPDKGATGKKSKFHMPSMHMPGNSTAQKMASAFKKKMRLKKTKGEKSPTAVSDGCELLAADDDDDDGASWLEDSDEDGNPFALEHAADDVEASPDAEAGVLPATFDQSARSTPSTTRSRSPERGEDADGTSSEVDELAASSSSSARPPVDLLAHAMEAGCAPAMGSPAEESSRSKTAAEETTSRPRPQVFGSSSSSTGNRSSPEGRKRPPREPQVTWDSKRFKDVKPLQCSSIWDIPTSKDPNPEPRPEHYDVVTSSLMSSATIDRIPAQKKIAFGSADLPPDVRPKHQHKPKWYRRRRCWMLLAGVVLFVIVLIATLKALLS